MNEYKYITWGTFKLIQLNDLASRIHSVVNEHTFVNECMDEEEKFIVVNGIQNKLRVELKMNGK